MFPVPAAVLNQWVRILGALEKKISRQSFETWLKPTRFSHVADRVLHVRIPSADFQAVCERYDNHITEAIDQLGLELDSVVFEVPPVEQKRRPHPRGWWLCPAARAQLQRAAPRAAQRRRPRAGPLRLEHRRATEPALPVRWLRHRLRQPVRACCLAGRLGAAVEGLQPRSSCTAASAWAKPT